MPRPPKPPSRPPAAPRPSGGPRFAPGGPRPASPRPGGVKAARPHGPPRAAGKPERGPDRVPERASDRPSERTGPSAAPGRARVPTLSIAPRTSDLAPGRAPERGSEHAHAQTQGSAAGARGRAVAPSGAVWLYGTHAVAAALRNPQRRIRRLLVTHDGEAALATAAAKPWAVGPEPVERARLDALLGRETVHQGIALLADILAVPSLSAVLERPGPVLILDQVTDPRNVGAILRSAAAFGACCVIAQDRHAPDESGAMARAASGAMETVPLLRAVNIARTIIALKAASVWCVGLDAAARPLRGEAFAGRRVALVLGAEDEGLRRLTRETCDEVAALRMRGGMESLNVAAAAAIALYELAR